MAGACCSKGLGSVLAVAATAAVGLGGYNWYTTGCPLGACHKGDEARVINTSDTSGVKHSCCEDGVDTLQAKSETGHSCCEGEAKAPCCEQSEADKAKDAEKAKEAEKAKDIAKAPAEKPAG